MGLRQDALDGFAKKVRQPIAWDDDADESRMLGLITKQVHPHGPICGSLTYPVLVGTIATELQDTVTRVTSSLTVPPPPSSTSMPDHTDFAGRGPQPPMQLHILDVP
jgi:hypothetical protein